MSEKRFFVSRDDYTRYPDMKLSFEYALAWLKKNPTHAMQRSVWHHTVWVFVATKKPNTLCTVSGLDNEHDYTPDNDDMFAKDWSIL